MYGRLYQQRREEPKRVELDYQLVGALMRLRKDITHVAQMWGDSEVDSRIPGLYDISQQYTHQEIMMWIMQNYATAEQNYSGKWSAMWNSSDKLAVDVTSKGVPIMVSVKGDCIQEIAMNRGILNVGQPSDQISHQLASLIVAMNPPAVMNMQGKKVCRPTACDIEGIYGPSVVTIPEVEEIEIDGEIMPESRDGGPLYQAYMPQEGGIEGLVMRLESFLNTPTVGTVMQQHTDICNNMWLMIEQARVHGSPFPPDFCPFKMEQYKGEDKSRMNYQLVYSQREFPTLEAMHHGLLERRSTCDLSRYVYDGHYFSDMPEGLARRIHMIGNIMDCIYYIGSLPIYLPSVSGYLSDIRYMMPLNLRCVSKDGSEKGGQWDGFHDRRFQVGHFKQGTGPEVHFRQLEEMEPCLTEKGVRYGDRELALSIALDHGSQDFGNNVVAYVQFAQPGLWEDPLNFIYPLNLNDGRILVVRGIRGGRTRVGHVTLVQYRALVSRFFFSRNVFPYSRITWPQISGVRHARVVIKCGPSSAYATMSDYEGQYVRHDSKVMKTHLWEGEVARELRPGIILPSHLPQIGYRSSDNDEY